MDKLIYKAGNRKGKKLKKKDLLEEKFMAYDIIMVNDSFEEQINLKDENDEFIDFTKNQNK